jgi:hypothetical protein
MYRKFYLKEEFVPAFVERCTCRKRHDNEYLRVGHIGMQNIRTVKTEDWLKLLRKTTIHTGCRAH